MQIDEWRGRQLGEGHAASRALGAHCCAWRPASTRMTVVVRRRSVRHEAEAEPILRPPTAPGCRRCLIRRPRRDRASGRARPRRDPAGLEAAIVQAIIGDRPLHPAQRRDSRSVCGAGQLHCWPSWPRGAASR
ncbi:MAG: hypothetical protein ACLTDR_15355 [Adlercreutzia equolifaciens]